MQKKKRSNNWHRLAFVCLLFTGCASGEGPPQTPEPREDCRWRDAAGATHIVVECWEHWAEIEQRKTSNDDDR